MKKNLCWIIFCIDRSGSMTSIRKDMIGGFNSFIETQKKANIGECKIFAYSFDTDYNVMFNGVDINDNPQLNELNYVPRGGTALYDSLGKTIVDIGNTLSALNESERPEKILVVTITDGEDNSNLTGEYEKYSLKKIKEIVSHQTNVYKWEFAYIGANQDVWSVGGSMGVRASNNLAYAPTSAGTAYAFDSLSRSTTCYRTSPVSASFSFTPDDQATSIAKIPVKAVINPNKKPRSSKTP